MAILISIGSWVDRFRIWIFETLLSQIRYHWNPSKKLYIFKKCLQEKRIRGWKWVEWDFIRNHPQQNGPFLYYEHYRKNSQNPIQLFPPWQLHKISSCKIIPKGATCIVFILPGNKHANQCNYIANRKFQKETTNTW